MEKQTFTITQYDTNTQEVTVDITSDYISAEVSSKIKLKHVPVKQQSDVYVYLKHRCQDIIRNVWKQENKDYIFSDIELFFNNNKKVFFEIIFDTNTFSFKEIVSFMEMNKSANIAFKNAFFSSDFLIGSNSSNDRGKVILMENLSE